MRMNYSDFLATKQKVVPDVGIDIDPNTLNPMMFNFQRAVTAFCLRKGRAALWLDTGLGKTVSQLQWSAIAAEETNGRALIFAPLSVAYQTVEEGRKFGIPVTYAKHQSESVCKGITITNYERMDGFSPKDYGALCLDESGILKSMDGVTRKKVTEFAQNFPYRLGCTATPAPNDLVELANHAEFLGVSTRGRMLATYFINGQVKGGGKASWRLKGHARRAFFRWLASWAMALKRPSDIGFNDDGFILPPLNISPVIVQTDVLPSDRLLWGGLKGIQDRTAVRRATLEQRVNASADLIAAEPDEQWLIWCGLDCEAEAMQKALTARGLTSQEVKGSDDAELKAQYLMEFAHGTMRRLVTKPKIASHGMNFQRCARMVFVGIGDSFESYYQCLRRCWRYGQDRAVHAYVVFTELEGDIYNNVLRKEREAEELSRELIAQVKDFEQAELGRVGPISDIFTPKKGIELPSWLTNRAL